MAIMATRETKVGDRMIYLHVFQDRVSPPITQLVVGQCYAVSSFNYPVRGSDMDLFLEGFGNVPFESTHFEYVD